MQCGCPRPFSLVELERADRNLSAVHLDLARDPAGGVDVHAHEDPRGSPGRYHDLPDRGGRRAPDVLAASSEATRRGPMAVTGVVARGATSSPSPTPAATMATAATARAARARVVKRRPARARAVPIGIGDAVSAVSPVATGEAVPAMATGEAMATEEAVSPVATGEAVPAMATGGTGAV